jgi:hypothetical protein
LHDGECIACQIFFFACRQRRSIENKYGIADERLEELETKLKVALAAAAEADSKYDEVSSFPAGMILLFLLIVC